jgi:hypothetical protein
MDNVIMDNKILLLAYHNGLSLLLSPFINFPLSILKFNYKRSLRHAYE